MDWMMAGLPAGTFALVLGITLFSAFVKGAVGFAMPLIMMGAFSAFLPPQTALAALILPTVFTNVAQAFRDGPVAAWASMVQYRRLLIATVVCIVISAQFVTVIPRVAFLLMLGIPITAYAALQLSGRPMVLRIEHRNTVEWVSGIIGGIYGGVSGIWGPPLIVYLLSTHTPKQETLRVQGVVFLIGAVVLLSAHLQSGVMNAVTLPFSAALVVPAALGMWAGQVLGRRLDHERFRRWTQILLVATGLNLIRAGLSA